MHISGQNLIVCPSNWSTSPLPELHNCSSVVCDSQQGNWLSLLAKTVYHSGYRLRVKNEALGKAGV